MISLDTNHSALGFPGLKAPFIGTLFTNLHPIQGDPSLQLPLIALLWFTAAGTYIDVILFLVYALLKNGNSNGSMIGIIAKKLPRYGILGHL
ncbi:MAG: hypothetical protein DJ555_02815 [Desulfurococcaceae archaeon]|nr:MAG: hypothetical protein DJ555_02815 [Desulfurococcaceae archaeon]